MKRTSYKVVDPTSAYLKPTGRQPRVIVPGGGIEPSTLPEIQPHGDLTILRCLGPWIAKCVCKQSCEKW